MVPLSPISPNYKTSFISGLLVGFGTTLGNGCTSGHGICGLGRKSKRSLAAVLTFLPVGIITASIGKKLFLGVVSSEKDIVSSNENSKVFGCGIFFGLGCCLLNSIRNILKNGEKKEKKVDDDDEDENNNVNLKKEILPPLLSSILFTTGLSVSGMIQLSRVQGYLNVLVPFEKWDGTLNLVLGSGVITSLVAYQIKEKLKKPLLCKNECDFSNIPSNSGAKITKRLILGSAIFGAGWGLGGLCPGPALVQLVNGSPLVLYAWFPGFVMGKRMFPFMEKKGWLKGFGVN